METSEHQNIPIPSEREYSTVKTILYEVVRHDAPHNYPYPDDKVHLIGEQIYHEQQVIKDALRKNDIDLSITREPMFLGAIFHPRRVFQLRGQNSLLRRRNQELDHLWVQEDEKLRAQAGVKWEDLNEVFADLGYPPLAEFTRKKEHGLHHLVPKSKGIYIKVYGNTILLPSYPDATFFESIEHLGVQDQMTRQLIDPGQTDSPIGLYRLVAPYKQWVLATEAKEDRMDKYQDDPNFRPSYYPGLLIPTREEVVNWVAAPYLHRD